MATTDPPPPSNHPRYNMPFIWLICLVAAMGGLLFGYDWVVIGGAKPFYETFFGIQDNSVLQGWAMSSALIGCLLGAVISGAAADYLGRKRLLITAAALFTISAVGTALAWDFYSFNVFRVIGGAGIGLASALSPMYIAEVSPGAIRGRLVSVNQLTIVIGILAAQIVNWLIAEPVPTIEQLRLLNSSEAQIEAYYSDVEGFDLDQAKRDAAEVVDEQLYDKVIAEHPGLSLVRVDPETQTEQRKEALAKEDREVMSAYIFPSWNGVVGWRWMFGAETVPAAAFFLLMFFVPESPRWLMKYGRDQQAEEVLRRIGGAEHARAEVADIRQTLATEEIAQVRFGDLLEPRLRTIVLMGVILAVFQQWCGINVIFNYAHDIFREAGYEVGDNMFNIVVTGITNLVFTFVALFTVDRFGRRPLMLIGSAGLAMIYAMLGAGYYFQIRGPVMLVLVVAAIACYAMSLAPVVWVVISEIFPNRIRGAAMAVAVFALWTGCTTLTFTFPILNEGFHHWGIEWAGLGASGTFWLYGGICVAGFLYILLNLPETKGKSLEQIERELVD